MGLGTLVVIQEVDKKRQAFVGELAVDNFVAEVDILVEDTVEGYIVVVVEKDNLAAEEDIVVQHIPVEVASRMQMRSREEDFEKELHSEWDNDYSWDLFQKDILKVVDTELEDMQMVLQTEEVDTMVVIEDMVENKVDTAGGILIGNFDST